MYVRRLAVALVAASSMAATGAFAAGSSVVSDTLASGSEPVTACDGSPTWGYDFAKDASTGEVTSISVTEIDPGCNGGQLTVNIEPAGAEASAMLGTADCSVSCTKVVTFASPLLPDDVDHVDAIIVGP